MPPSPVVRFFDGVEAERGEIAERADAECADRRAEGVGGVLDEAQVVRAGEGAETVHRGRSAGEVHRQQGHVRGVIAAAAADGSRFIVDRSMSASTGVAPVCRMALSVAQKVNGVVTTSSRGAAPAASSERCSAAVPELTATACARQCSGPSPLRAHGPGSGGQPARTKDLDDRLDFSGPMRGGAKPMRISAGRASGCSTRTRLTKPPW